MKPEKLVIKTSFMHPSLNEILNMHWAKRSEVRDACHFSIIEATTWMRPLQPDKNGIFKKKVIITLRYFFPTKAKHDYNNYSGKYIFDALVKEGIIADDSDKEIAEMHIEFGHDKNNPHTEIIIEET